MSTVVLEPEALSKVLLAQNPKSGAEEVWEVARSTAVLVKLVSELSSNLRERLEEAHFEARARDALASALEEDGRIPWSEEAGEGLGQPLDRATSLKRLQTIAEPTSLEEWAGQVAGATELEQRYKIARSTLQSWRKQKAVVGLLKGVKKEVFPLRQFIDGRPAEGIAAVREIISAPRVAWFWLISLHVELDDRAPIDLLKEGRVAEVISLAQADYGQP